MSSEASITQLQDQARKNLRDPTWRLRNLYYILDKDGQKVLFAPNTAQEQLLRDMWFRNVILKARQRGLSTLVQLVMLDTCLFVENTRAAVIAHDQDSANIIFRDKVRFAYDNMPELVRQMVPLKRDSASELVLANNSSLRVATSVRSSTLNYLHISEFGKICAKYPEKAREIMTGSLPAVDKNGLIFIESTAEGREGAFYDMCVRTMAAKEQGRKPGKLDMRFHFYSWWDAPEYEIEPEGVIVTPRDHAYFNRMETEIGQSITTEKRAWYVSTRDNTFGGDAQMMKREYPTTWRESFEESNEGTYFIDQLAKARREGRITVVQYDPRVPVNTFWDIGNEDDTVIWFHQQVGNRDNWIDCLAAGGEPPSYYAREMQAKGYVYGKHFLPHDGAKRQTTHNELKTYADMLEDLGLSDIEIVPRIDDVTRGIQMVREQFGTYWFDEERCAEGLQHIERYRKEWNERLGAWSARPRHDMHSHAADAIRQHAQAHDAGLIRTNTQRNTPRRRRAGGMAV